MGEVPPPSSVGTLSGGVVTSELGVPVLTGTPVEPVPPGRATTSVGVGVSKALLHQHPHTVGTVVAAGSRLPQVPTPTPTPRIAFSNHHVSVFLNTPMLLCHLLAHRMPLHLVWGWMRSPEGSVPSQPRTPGGGTHIFPRLRECTPGRGLAGPPHPALNSCTTLRGGGCTPPPRLGAGPIANGSRVRAPGMGPLLGWARLRQLP